MAVPLVLGSLGLNMAEVCQQWRIQQHSYLLRLWRSGVDGEWRASLQSVQSGERHIFVDLESLLTFLVEEANPPAKWSSSISPVENG